MNNFVTKETETYNRIWRWHFYAGLIITPIMLVMAITGCIYLFESEIDDVLYGKLLYKDAGTAGHYRQMDHNAILTAVGRQYPIGEILSYRPSFNNRQNAQVIFETSDGRKLSVFVNPHGAGIVGNINETWRLTRIAKAIHGGLMAGTTGEVIVELVACWTIIMVITGLYLWWPRKRGGWGVFLPRLNAKGRLLWRDLHAIPGFFLSFWILLIITTGLPWSVVWGNLLDKFAISIGAEFPQEIFVNRPQSNMTADDQQLDINSVISVIEQKNFQHDYEIEFPWGVSGTFAVMPLRHGGTANDTSYLFIDQYSGDVRKDIGWNDIGVIGRATSWGIRLHEGRLFGRLNQILNLIAVLVLISMSITGVFMWFQRKPKGQLGAPSGYRALQTSKAIRMSMITLGIVMPLAGTSMLLLWCWDRLYARVNDHDA